MKLTGLERLVFGVEDMDLCAKFWRDRGLKTVIESPHRGVFETAEKAQVEIRPINDPELPPAVINGSTLREIVWSAEDQDTVGDLVNDLSADREVVMDEHGVAHTLDPEGYGIGFQVSQKVELPEFISEYNAPARVERVNKPAEFYKYATPQHLAHVVLHITDLENTPPFYLDRLGFKVTDRYTDRGAFLRCGGAMDHHNLFLFCLDGKKGFHHTAFEVRDIHEVFGGGLRMQEQGWTTHLGPGRHNVTSAYYWYFNNPCGGAAEYGFDTDRVSDAWIPRDIIPSDGAFAEWSLEEGMARFSGLQRAVKNQEDAA